MATDLNIFRTRLPLSKPSQTQEDESGGQRVPPSSEQRPGEVSLQVKGEGRTQLRTPSPHFSLQSVPLSSPQATLLGLAALHKAFPEVLAPGSRAQVTLSSPWPHPLPWPCRVLAPQGARDPRVLLLKALGCPELRALEAGTATELLDVFSGLEADGHALAEALATGEVGTALPGRAAELRAALECGPRGLALRLWPQLQVVVTLDAGGQAEAVSALDALWCRGLVFFSPAYAAAGGELRRDPLPRVLPLSLPPPTFPPHQQLHFLENRNWGPLAPPPQWPPAPPKHGRGSPYPQRP